MVLWSEAQLSLTYVHVSGTEAGRPPSSPLKTTKSLLERSHTPAAPWRGDGEPLVVTTCFQTPPAKVQVSSNSEGTAALTPPKRTESLFTGS